MNRIRIQWLLSTLLQVAVADIPGLIEGSHLNRGLGISFLRHIEKCACLLYVIDMSVKEPWKHLQQLQYELEQYMKHLSKRLVAISQMLALISCWGGNPPTQQQNSSTMARVLLLIVKFVLNHVLI